MNSDLAALIALNRFGLGARPGEIAQVGADAVGFLKAQLKAKPTAPRLMAAKRYQSLVAGADGPEKLNKLVKAGIPLYRGDIVARVNAALTTPDSFRERLVYFWSNHFAVSIDRPVVATFAASYEEEAIRPFVTGRFIDMLLAVARHPAMLLYLDNIRSAGENSLAAQRGKRNDNQVGLNENFAREVMELHTLGVDAGYTQADVRAMARILTGWSIEREGPQAGHFLFRAQVHEPGAHTVFGRNFAAGGVEQGVAALTYLAQHPATAKHIAAKLVRHFTTDTPSPAAVERIAAVFTQTGGDLGAVSAALVDLPEAWATSPAKYKSPHDFIISSLRALGLKKMDESVLSTFEVLGQRNFAAPSPQGWPDVESAWLSGESLRRRVDWAYALAQRLPPGKADARTLAQQALGPWLSGDTAFTVANAPSNAEGIALCLVSPEFQRR